MAEHMPALSWEVYNRYMNLPQVCNKYFIYIFCRKFCSKKSKKILHLDSKFSKLYYTI